MMEDPALYSLLKEFKAEQTPIFTSGEIYLSALMDALISQSYFSPALMTVMRQLIIGDSQKKAKKSGKILDGDFSNVRTSNLY
jgi:hypothetical protein